MKMGNIQQYSFRDVWHSEKAFEVRNRVKNLKCPRCWVGCETYSIKFGVREMMTKRRFLSFYRNGEGKMVNNTMGDLK